MVVQLTPEQLAAYLDVMRKAGLVAAHLEIPWMFAEGELPMLLKMNVTFGPDAAPLPGEKPTPGGWKGPEHLDAEFKPEEPLP